MKLNSLLPHISDRNHYVELFKQNSPWEPAIQYLVAKHQLNGEVHRGTLGSHVVYRVGNCWLKLMAPIFAKDMVFELSGLRAVEGKLSVETPKIIAEGVLEGWPYVILSHIQGEPIRNIWKKLNSDQQIRIANQIAKVTTEISRCQPEAPIKNRFLWNEFILQQYRSCEEQQYKKGLPEPWVFHVKEFLQTFDISEFQTQDPVFLHADLTFDHFLITEDPDPKISGIIDMADCQIGHLEYELVAPTVFIFKGHPQLLSRYLSQCGFNPSDLNTRFSEKLLAWSLLHRYFSLISYCQDEMDSCVAGDFHSLARKVFPLIG